MTGLALKCRICGVAVTYGSVLPFVHTEHRPVTVRPHYAFGIPTSSGGHQPAAFEDRLAAGALHGSPDDSPLGRG